MCAFYENDTRLDPVILRSCIASVLPRYCIPERFIYKKTLPLTERGKLDYKALTLPKEEREAEDYEAPQAESEKILCEAFEHILKTGRPVGRNESFFELGGDSVTGMLLLVYLGGNHDLHYTIEDLFDHSKPCELACVPGSEKKEEPDSGTAEALQALPEELVNLKDEADTEEILPAETASGLYLFLQESESAYQRGLTFSLRVRLGRIFGLSNELCAGVILVAV